MTPMSSQTEPNERTYLRRLYPYVGCSSYRTSPTTIKHRTSPYHKNKNVQVGGFTGAQRPTTGLEKQTNNPGLSLASGQIGARSSLTSRGPGPGDDTVQNLAEQSVAIGSPLTRVDRRVRQ